jgi:RepB DNA-primase from phage plasmid
MNGTATDFLTRCFAPGDTIALLLRNESTSTTQQRVVPLERALAPRYRGWLAHENHNGGNIYVAANPLLAGSRRRTKDCIASVRHLYIDIDVNGETRLAALRASDLVPEPNVVVSTSAGKYQVLWRVEGFDFYTQEVTLKLLTLAFHGDIACTDCNRVLRIPGFRNCKYDPPQLVTVEYVADATYQPDDFRLYTLREAACIPPIRTQYRRPDLHTHSDHDWAWVSQELAHGKDAMTLTQELASRRSDKPNPSYYAQRTVDMASARLWLLEGTAFEDVITLLERRRQVEIPSATCSARAREIAATAQRMIARR